MKAKILISIVTLLFSVNHSYGQLLEELKKRAKEKGLETQEVSYDSTAYDESKDRSDIEGLDLAAAQDFFNKDVVMITFDQNGNEVQTSYFDNEVVAMRTETKVTDKPIYHDSTGKFYAFNVETNQYESMSLLPSSTMGFMTAGMTTQIYKLPQEPYFEAFEALSNMDIALNFLILELAFVYKPEHFEGDDFYREQAIPCFPDVCKRFYYNDTEYNGSYIQFDSKGRLVEFFINSTASQFEDDRRNPSGKFTYTYEDCEVEVPDAVEQSMVPGPLGKIIDLNKGLEPWKHNKKDKIKQKN